MRCVFKRDGDWAYCANKNCPVRIRTKQPLDRIMSECHGNGPPPTLIDRVKTVTKAVVNYVMSGGPNVNDEEKERRMSICRECPFFVHESQTCKECTCAMNLKTRMESEHCPIGKW